MVNGVDAEYRSQTLTRAPGTVPAQRSPGDDRAAPPPRSEAAAGRIVLIEPDHATAESLIAALSAVGATDVTAFSAATEPRGALPAPGGDDPAADLAVVSLHAGPSALDTIATLKRSGWRRVVAITSTGGADDIVAAVAAGATGAMTMGDPSAARAMPTGIYDLSDREVEVLSRVADGRSNKWIGEHLGLSALTVKSHLARIGRKLGTGDRAHMVALALRAGVVQ